MHTPDDVDRPGAESLLVHQARILEGVASGVPLTGTLEEICRVVESLTGDALCSFLFVDDEGRLRPAAGPRLPDAYTRALDGVPIGPSTGSCGTAAYRGSTVVVEDIATDPLWERYRDLALEHDLRACWSTPILEGSDGRVLGTFAVYYREPRRPPDEHVHVVDLMVHVARIAIEHRGAQMRLAHQANHDPLTGLANRALFLELLDHALDRARRSAGPVAVLLLDLDRFKVVNDSLGHDVGDDLLVLVARRLSDAVRPGDSVARFGGDEFTILCEDLSRDDARREAASIAERLLDALRFPFEVAGDELYLDASVGIAIGMDPDARGSSLLRDADAAMYRAKGRGGGGWALFDETMQIGALRRLELERTLHHAVERGEFRVYYQPVLSVREHRWVGAEALVRWYHPERGIVGPDEFIAVAEDTGLILPLGRWVLREACHQAAAWRAGAGGDGFGISVNLSARQVADPDLVPHVSAALEESGLPGVALTLEITESILMEPTHPVVQALRAVRDLGVRLSIDDFGTGYSSFGYLRRFRVDELKIDREFVAGLGSDRDDSTIVAAIVSMGHTLGLDVVAEGVETRVQLAQLRALRCNRAQGYLLVRPAPAASIDEVLRAAPRREGAGLVQVNRAR